MKKSKLTLKKIPFEKILSTRRNPRSDLETDPSTSSGQALQGLVISLGNEKDPRLVGPPVVEQLDNDRYRILAGERRVQAAQLAGWQSIDCLVRPCLDPVTAHTLRLVENLHRQPLHPLDKAAALKISWLSTNAEAMNLTDETREILELEQLPHETLSQLADLLESHGFIPTHPAVSWDQVLDDLGLELNPASRKKLLRVLTIAPTVQTQVRELDVTEAALRSLGQMDAEDQETLVKELSQNPDLTRRVRRISHAVRKHGYSVDQAIAEAKGQVVDEISEAEDLDGEEINILDDPTMDTVLQLLDAANQVIIACQELETLLKERSPKELIPPWGEYTTDSIEMIRNAINAIPQ
jgi:ParB/RepB/Spo0J family partition protein